MNNGDPRLVSGAPQRYVLPANTSAIQVLAGPEGHSRLGMILRLPEGAQVEMCGEGFNERTVKVRCEGSLYFVFIEDLHREIAVKAKGYATG